MNKEYSPDKRRSLRRHVQTDIKITFNKRSYYAEIRDMSLGGMFIDLDSVLIPKGAHVEVSMLKFRQGVEYPTFTTQVAYVTPRGYGLYFSDLQVDNFRQLQEILFNKGH